MSNSEASCSRVPQLIGQQLVAQLRQIPRGQIDIDLTFSRSGARCYTHFNVGWNTHRAQSKPVRALAQDWRFRHFEAQERRKRPPWISPGGLIPAYILFRFSIALFDLEYKNIRRRACRARLWRLGAHGTPYLCEFAKQSASQLTQSNRRDGVFLVPTRCVGMQSRRATP